MFRVSYYAPASAFSLECYCAWLPLCFYSVRDSHSVVSYFPHGAHHELVASSLPWTLCCSPPNSSKSAGE